MDKFKFFQILKLFVMAILLCITPFLSTPLRPPYIYFIVNLLIIALGAEAGLLSFIFKRTESDKKTSTTSTSSTDHNVATQQPVSISSDDSVCNKEKPASINARAGNPEAETTAKKEPKAVEKSSSEKIVGQVKKVGMMKKSPSMPSLFFIGDGGDYRSNDDAVEVLHHDLIEEENADDYEQETRDDHEIDGHELFHQAETFIGNFHKHLKMQREDSWNKLQELYHKAI